MTRLASYFRGVSAKLLSSVECDPSASNQHELNGTVAMQSYLGTHRQEFNARFIYVSDNEEYCLSVLCPVTWYDARENHPTRKEYRLYFADNGVMGRAAPGDILITALDTHGQFLIVVLDENHSMRETILWWFGLSGELLKRFSTIDVESTEIASSALFNYVADELGLEVSSSDPADWTTEVVSEFGDKFPSTVALSQFARQSLGNEIDLRGSPDQSLLLLLDREEALFRALEKHIVGKYLESNADQLINDVDEFISFSLSVQNRRKSRAGHALENHVASILDAFHLNYSKGETTEARSKPDFLFPGQDQYKSEDFPDERLTMLGAKTSCKDRWRQVLTEANRIQKKHLLTLQPSISQQQTDQMRREHLTLILPEPLHSTYNQHQRSEILNLAEFIQLVEERQEMIQE